MTEFLGKFLILSERYSKGHRRRISEEIHGKLLKRILDAISEEILMGVSEGSPGEVSLRFSGRSFERILERYPEVISEDIQ